MQRIDIKNQRLFGYASLPSRQDPQICCWQRRTGWPAAGRLWPGRLSRLPVRSAAHTWRRNPTEQAHVASEQP